MIWRNPVAWFGLATLLIPVLIHLLVRHRAEPRLFPSLRFIQPTRLASVRRKMISDWPLLLVRIAMLAAAVAALADPLWQSAARRAEWNERWARAVVIDTTPSVTGAGATAALAEREVAGAIKAEMIQTKQLADGIRRASAWLRTAPPARRELVVISDFQLGALDAAMLRDIPSHVGIRLVRAPGTPVTRTVDGLARTQRATGGGFTLRNPHVTLNTSETAVTWADASSPSAAVDIDKIDAASTPNAADITLRPFDLKLRGSAADRPFLVAASEAVLAQGVPVAAGTAGSGHNSATIIIGNAATGDAGVLLAPWQVDAVRAIATDASLTRAAGRAATAVAATRTDRTTASASESATPEPPSPEAAAKTRAASNASSDSPTRLAAAKAGSSVTSSAAARTAESTLPEPSSSEAAAKSRTASNGASDAPAPWIVLTRDAGGSPAVLAAADGAHGDTRMLIWSRVAAADEATALLIRATLRALAGTDAFAEAEVIAIPDATLAQWQRPASEPPASEWRDVDGNDRRWLWGAVLALIVAEQVLRRRARHVDAQADRKVFEHAA